MKLIEKKYFFNLSHVFSKSAQKQFADRSPTVLIFAVVSLREIDLQTTSKSATVQLTLFRLIMKVSRFRERTGHMAIYL